MIPGEVCLESSSPGVLDADHVCVVCPDIFEKVLKVSLVLDPNALPQHSQPEHEGRFHG